MTAITIKKADEDLQVVYGEVYTPDYPDAQGEFMTAETVRATAYRFMLNGRTSNVDTNHDNKLNGSVVVESFIARAGDPDFIENAWVVAIYVPDPELWAKILSNELNGLSFEAAQRLGDTPVEFEIPEFVEGDTDEYEAHTHTFKVRFSPTGEYLGGVTNVVNGHAHTIKRGVVTELSQGHAHRYSLYEG